MNPPDMPWCEACQCYHHDAAYCIKAKGDVLRRMQLPNPPGWNEPGMQPINWAELQTTAIDYTNLLLRRIAHLMTSDVTDDPVVDRCYLAAFEAWQRQQTRPETRWQFADRMAKQEGKR